MNFDFHTHGKLTKYDEFSLKYFRTLVKAAQESGLDGFALTEHFNTRHFFDVFGTLDDFYPYQDGYYLVEGIRVFPGIEVHTKEMDHLLLIADRTVIRNLRMQLQPFTHKLNYISFEKLMDLVKLEEVLVIGGHPLAHQKAYFELHPSHLEKLDAIELNAKDLSILSTTESVQEVYYLGMRLAKPVVGGTSAFHKNHYGRVYTKLHTTCSTVRDLKRAVQNEQFTVKVAPAASGMFLHNGAAPELGVWGEPYL